MGRHKYSKKQKIWNYIRRNRVFRVGDLMSIQEIKASTMRAVLHDLVSINAIKPINQTRNLADKEYESLLTYTFWYPRRGSHEKVG